MNGLKRKRYNAHFNFYNDCFYHLIGGAWIGDYLHRNEGQELLMKNDAGGIEVGLHREHSGITDFEFEVISNESWSAFTDLYRNGRLQLVGVEGDHNSDALVEKAVEAMEVSEDQRILV